MAEGHSFESAVATLFLLRGSGKCLNFELANNMESTGGKFDDIIFKFKTDNKSKDWRYRYLQAKHKTDEGKKIRSNQLLEEEGDFSLAKYFRSYCRMVDRKEVVHDCIIFTNIGFDVQDLETEGIELEEIKTTGDILDFSSTTLKNGKKPTSYKLKLRDQSKLRRHLLEKSNDKLLANKLQELGTKNKITDLRNEILQAYHISLIVDKVIEIKGSPNGFCQDFVKGTNLSAGAMKLHENLTSLQIKENNWQSWTFNLNNTFGKKKHSTVVNPLPTTATDVQIHGFLDKLVFVVNSPNATEMEQEVLPADFRKYYCEQNCLAQMTRVLKYITEWINKKNCSWLTTTDGTKQLLSGVIDESDKYQQKLQENMGLSAAAIDVMTKKLEPITNGSSSESRVYRITTPSPSYTAIKVIGALKTPILGCRYLVTPSSYFQNSNDKQRWKNRMKLLRGSNHVLVVVCQDSDPITQQEDFEKFLPENNTVVLIGGEHGELTDEINFNDFDSNSQETILSKTISFQGKDQTLRDLIHPSGMEPAASNIKDVIDWPSIKEMIIDEKKVYIPAFDATRFQQSLYINRRIIKVEFDRHFYDEVAKILGCSNQDLQSDFRVDPKGNIEWQTKDRNRKKKILETIKMILERKNPIEKSEKSLSINNTSSVDDLINVKDDWGRRAVIISGVAGTGKSTVLSHYYAKIREANPDWWIVKINLSDYSEVLKKIDNSNFDTNNKAFEFLVNLPTVVGHSPFACSLLRHRLKTGNRVVLMLDGFDEIDNKCQKAAIQFMKAVTRTDYSSVIRLYVTTRPHALEDLELELSQLGYTLDNFDEKDQIKCLTKFWKDELLKGQDSNEQDDKVLKLNTYSETLVGRVNNSFENEDREFIGVPLQCRIVAECFLETARSKIMVLNDDEIFSNQKEYQEEQMEFDLANLYKRLMKTKKQVFLREKLKIPQNVGVDGTEEDGINHCFLAETMKNIQSHLFMLAVKTIILEREHVEILLPPRPLVYQSAENRYSEKERLDKLSISYGLTDRNGKGKIEFLHRTYAEYLVADYLYQGFVLDEKRHNNLLEFEKPRNFIMQDLMKCNQYSGIVTFLNSMLKWLINSQEWRMIIDERQNNKMIPNRFHQIANIIANNRHNFGVNMIFLSVEMRKFNMLTLFWDCLDATFHRTKVREIIYENFGFPCHSSNNWTPSGVILIMTLDVKNLKRFLDYFDEANDSKILYVLRQCMSETNTFQEFIKETVKLSTVFDFMKNHRESLEHVLQSSRNLKRDLDESNHHARQLWDMSVTLMIDETNSANNIETCFELVSIYESDQFVLEDLLEELFFHIYLRRIDCWIIFKNKGLKKLLIGLRDRGRQKTLKGLRRYVLIGDPGLFKKVYKPELPNNELSADIQWPLSRDCCGLTLLHRVALCGDPEVVKRITETMKRKFNDQQQLMDCSMESVDMEDNQSNIKITPFFLAALCGDEDTARQLLTFSLKNGNGLVNDSLQESVRCQKIDTYEFLLNFAKRTLGQSKLINLCRSIVFEDSFISNSRMLEFIDTSVDVIFQNDASKESFMFFSELFLNNQTFFYQRKRINDGLLQGMLQVVEADWLGHFFNERKLSEELLRHFHRNVLSENQRQQISSAITLSALDGRGEIGYFWKTLVSNRGWLTESSEYEDPLDRIMKWIVDVLGENVLKDFLLRSNGNNSNFIVQALLIPGGVDFANKTLALFTDTDTKHQVHNCLVEKGPRLIKDKLFCLQDNKETFRPIVSSHDDKKLLEVLAFYLENSSSEQLSTFVNDMTRTSLFESVILLHTDYVEIIGELTKLLSEKLGDEAVEIMVLHKDDKGDMVVVSRYFREIWEVEKMYAHLPEKKRTEIRHTLLNAACASGQIQEFQYYFRNFTETLKYYMSIDERGVSMNLPHGFNVLCLYFIEKFDQYQIQQFIQLITAARSVEDCLDSEVTDRPYSIWSDYVEKLCVGNDIDADGLLLRSCQAIERLFKCIEEKVWDQHKFKTKSNLLFHDVGGGRVIDCAGQSDNFSIFKVMLTLFYTNVHTKSEILHETVSRLTVIESFWKKCGSRNISLMRYFLAEDVRGVADNLVDGLDLLSIYFLQDFNEDDLENFLRFVLQDRKNDSNNSSIWTDYIKEGCNQQGKSTVKTSNHLKALTSMFNCVSKLRREGLKKLLIDHTIKSLPLSNYPSEAVEVVVLLIRKLTKKNREPDRQVRRYTWEKLSQYWFNMHADLHYFVVAMDRVELNEFVDFILATNEDREISGKRPSIWADYMDNGTRESVRHGTLNNFFRSIRDTVLDLLKQVKHQLGDDGLKRLLNHGDNGDPAIFRHLKRIPLMLYESNTWRKDDTKKLLDQYREFAQTFSNERHKMEFLRLLSPSPLYFPRDWKLAVKVWRRYMLFTSINELIAHYRSNRASVPHDSSS